jgi:predicted RNase H-like HicB family nuclease
MEAALANLKEAVALFLEDEDAPRPSASVLVTSFEVDHDAAARGVGS